MQPVERNNYRVGRYAPSPTGRLHLGNLRTALLAWLQTRLVDGVFILRMENLDEGRTRPGAATAIVDDLRWLGLDWDEGPDCGGPAASYIQTERKAIYERALQQLLTSGRVFACLCSRKDIRAAASAPHGRDGIYPGTCRHRTLANGNADVPNEALRLRVDNTEIEFDDVVTGPQVATMANDSGDFVIRRRDGLFAYQLAVAVDDALMGVTDVVRGADLLDSTPRQLLLLDLLDLLDLLELPRPRYWHVPLLNDDQGRRLSKRDASSPLAAYRRSGLGPREIVGQLAAGLGLVEAGRALSARELLDSMESEAQLIRALHRAQHQAADVAKPRRT